MSQNSHTMKNLALIVILLFTVSSCSPIAKVILAVGPKLSNVDNPKLIYDGLGDNKKKAEDVLELTLDYFDGISKGDEYSNILDKYNEVLKSQNKIVDNFADGIVKGEEISYENMKPNIENVAKEIDLLKKMYDDLSQGDQNSVLGEYGGIEELLLKLAAEIAKKEGLKLYANTVIKEFSISDVETIKAKSNE